MCSLWIAFRFQVTQTITRNMRTSFYQTLFPDTPGLLVWFSLYLLFVSIVWCSKLRNLVVPNTFYFMMQSFIYVHLLSTWVRSKEELFLCGFVSPDNKLPVTELCTLVCWNLQADTRCFHKLGTQSYWPEVWVMIRVINFRKIQTPGGIWTHSPMLSRYMPYLLS